MNIKNIFLFFSIILLISSFSVIIFKNSIYSVICLISSFISSSVILILLECEFFAFLFLIVYVGAIAVLFMFVIMMLDIKNLSNKNEFKHYIFGLFSVFFVIVFLISVLVNFFGQNSLNSYINWYNEDIFSEIEIIGHVLYTHYTLQFLIAGLILFLAVLGVVSLTANFNKKNKASTIKQVSRIGSI